ncbi:MAG: NAD(P)H-hydrate dehydratase [Provencibacterium sp.]|jgi:hydroxyethylthiazole kinase-like uncharacterized protein yjeF|nr:NAD(P)H-hydrate dehydratase [Provencibacterium sp.]
MPSLLNEEMVFSHIPPKREDLHKSSAGRLYIVAGCRAFTGAPVLTLHGALHTGCGYVTLASTPQVCQSASYHLLTPTYDCLEENSEGRISAKAAAAILKRAAGYHALVLGCGLGLDEDIRLLVGTLLYEYAGSALIDADGINAMGGCIDIAQGKRERILTPHEGEMGRLLGRPTEWVHQNRLEAATECARKTGAVVVLKGPHTLIVSPEGEALENPSGNSGLAKAGSGDLLSGMIGSLLAQQLPALWAAACGVYLHGAAADLCAQAMSRFCMQPDDLTAFLPAIFLRNGR